MTAPHPSSGSSFKDRPLSPHLQVWRWTLPMTMSILHRASGVALSVGTLMLVWMLVAAATGAGAYDNFATFAKSDLGQFCLLGWTFAMYLHLFTGLRHLVMDTGAWMTIKGTTTASAIALLVPILLTAATWAFLKGWM